MLNNIRALYHIILNYHFYTIPIIINEILFNFKYDKNLNNFKYLKSNFLSDSIPCPFTFLKRIKSFVEKKNINLICDLGSGYGKVLYFFGKINQYKIDGIELDKDIYRISKSLENERINILNQNILDFDLNSKNYNLFILNDPVKKRDDLKKIVEKLKLIKRNCYFVFINLTPDKTKIINSNLEVIDSYIISNSKNIYFTKPK
ncbi:class I SAM-dependent methyltransferase [Candidatus Pelagibacter sp. HIMB1593]|uniref:class I SAM-dependent methyltransferase n=1 Tax=Candidatus Pelagibacter sp. HIMB1593 TaxID=3413355 RepID=UPI003F866E88